MYALQDIMFPGQFVAKPDALEKLVMKQQAIYHDPHFTFMGRHLHPYDEIDRHDDDWLSDEELEELWREDGLDYMAEDFDQEIVVSSTHEERRTFRKDMLAVMHGVRAKIEWNYGRKSRFKYPHIRRHRNHGAREMLHASYEREACEFGEEQCASYEEYITLFREDEKQELIADLQEIADLHRLEPKYRLEIERGRADLELRSSTNFWDLEEVHFDAIEAFYQQIADEHERMNPIRIDPELAIAV